MLAVLCIAMIAMHAWSAPLTFEWTARPQLVAFTFEGSISSAHLELTTKLVKNGPLSCSSAIPITWFVSSCSTADSTRLKQLISHGHEIGLHATDPETVATDLSCLKQFAEISGFRGSIIARSAAFTSGIAYDSSLALAEPSDSRSWPYLLSDPSGLIEVAYVDSKSKTSLLEAFATNYKNARAPFIISLSSLADSLGVAETIEIISDILGQSDVVAVTAHHIKRMRFVNSAASADTLVNVCRQSSTSSSNSTSNSSYQTSVPRQTVNPGTTAASASSGAGASDGTSAATTSPRSVVDLPTTTPFDELTTAPVPTTAFVEQTDAPEDSLLTTAPTTTTPTNGGSASSEESTSPTYVPYVLGAGGCVCAILVMVAYRVHRRADRFPAIVTGGYAFEAEDRDIFDLEAEQSVSQQGSSIGMHDVDLSDRSPRTFSGSTFNSTMTS